MNLVELDRALRQLRLSGMAAVNESVRSGGTKYEFSASFSFPPENLLTTIAPNGPPRPLFTFSTAS